MSVDEVNMILMEDLPKLCCGSVVKEYRFAPDRRFKADYALPQIKVLVEVEGGVFTNGRHVRGTGYVSDLEKYNLAALLGFRVYRFTPKQVKSGEAMRFLKKAVR